MRAAAWLCVLLLAGCSVWGPEGGPGGAGVAAPPGGPTLPAAAATDATAGPDGVQRVTVTTTDGLTFDPERVRARTGVIEFVFHNTGVTPHSVAVDIPPDQTTTGNLNGNQAATLRVTVTKPGRYPYPCLYHATSGMRGTLEVT